MSHEEKASSIFVACAGKSIKTSIAWHMFAVGEKKLFCLRKLSQMLKLDNSKISVNKQMIL